MQSKPSLLYYHPVYLTLLSGAAFHLSLDKNLGTHGFSANL